MYSILQQTKYIEIRSRAYNNVKQGVASAVVFFLSLFCVLPELDHVVLTLVWHAYWLNRHHSSLHFLVSITSCIIHFPVWNHHASWLWMSTAHSVFTQSVKATANCLAGWHQTTLIYRQHKRCFNIWLSRCNINTQSRLLRICCCPPCAHL